MNITDIDIKLLTIFVAVVDAQGVVVCCFRMFIYINDVILYGFGFS